MKMKCKFCLIRRPEEFHEKGICVHCGELFCDICMKSEKHIQVGYCPTCGNSIYNKDDETCYRLLCSLEKEVEEAILTGSKEKKAWAERIKDYLLICLGGRLYRGDGVKKDLDKAGEYYQKAADRGSVTGLYNLYCYYNESGKDEEEAMKILKLSADGGYSVAQLTYSMELRVKIWDHNFEICQKIKAYVSRGDVVQLFDEEPSLVTTCMEQNEETYRYLKMAALNGHPDALFELGVAFHFGQIPDHAITREMSSKEKQDKLQKLTRMAIIWYEKADEKGHAMAANNLGVIYKNGMGCIGNIEKSRQYYTKAHLAGCSNATHGLGTIHEHDGNEIEKIAKIMIRNGHDPADLIKEKNEHFCKAAYYYTSAADRNFLPGMFQLGYLMVTNRFCRDDEMSRIDQVKEGLTLIKDAAKRGCNHAKKYILKLMEENGDGPESQEIIDPYMINYEDIEIIITK